MGEVTIIRKVIELLPAIAIEIDVSPKVFQERMAQIAIESGFYELESLSDGMEMHILNFFPKDDLGYEGLGGQLIYECDKEDQIRVETRARRWIPEDATREVYLKATHHIFDNLIKTYNSKYKKRYRLRVIKEKGYKMPPKATKALQDFSYLANKTMLHPLDWQRLYEFVRVCHATRANPEKGLINGMLCKEGFDEKKAEYIADIASHLLDFMKYKR